METRKRRSTGCANRASRHWRNARGRDTDFGRMGIFADLSAKTGAMVELKCESAPVAGHDEFVQLANDLAEQLATGPGAESADELLDQPSPSKPGMTLREQKDELFNRIREVFNIGRMIRFDGPCAGYSHNAGYGLGRFAGSQRHRMPPPRATSACMWPPCVPRH